MDQSINIPWAPGMNYGMGINLLTGDVAGKAIQPIQDSEKEILKPIKAGGQVVSYDVVQINSLEELYSSIGMSIEASGRHGLFNASAKANYANQSKFNSQSTFVLAKCTVMNAFSQIEDPVIKEEAISLYKHPKNFRDRYGDGFVRGMQTGGELFVIISITSSTTEEQQSIAASLKASYGTKLSSVKVSGELSTETQSKISKSQLRVSTYQRGGLGKEQAFLQTIEDTIKRLQEFPSQIENNAVPYEVQVANYYTLPFPDEPENPIDIENQKNVLEEYSRIQLKYISLRNDVEFMQLHLDYFQDPIDLKTLNSWNDFFTRKIIELRRQASICSMNANECSEFPFMLPEDFGRFHEVQRKAISVGGRFNLEIANMKSTIESLEREIVALEESKINTLNSLRNTENITLNTERENEFNLEIENLKQKQDEFIVALKYLEKFQSEEV